MRFIGFQTLERAVLRYQTVLVQREKDIAVLVMMGAGSWFGSSKKEGKYSLCAHDPTFPTDKYTLGVLPHPHLICLYFPKYGGPTTAPFPHPRPLPHHHTAPLPPPRAVSGDQSVMVLMVVCVIPTRGDDVC